MNEPFQKKIFTIPNLLSLFRLCLIPVIVWLYLGREDYRGTSLVLLLSGITDVADGIIARRFNMVSDFGKAFDPVADKLTQIAMLFCLVARFPLMTMALAVLVLKELFAAVTGLLAIKKSGVVEGARWHGKAATVLLYGMMLVHLVWFRIPPGVSNVLILLCTGMLLVSAVLYGIQRFRVLSAPRAEGGPQRQEAPHA